MRFREKDEEARTSGHGYTPSSRGDQRDRSLSLTPPPPTKWLLQGLSHRRGGKRSFSEPREKSITAFAGNQSFKIQHSSVKYCLISVSCVPVLRIFFCSSKLHQGTYCYCNAHLIRGWIRRPVPIQNVSGAALFVS